ncbi:MAG: flagellar biosynthesis protein FlhB [Rhodocyclaceae bacterium]|nr:flagellar biosynthesis protein FlhB [Rhodocyclaceae bacterium]
MAEESDLERTEPPSSRRLEQAREEGQVPSSRELSAFLVMAAGTLGLWGLAGWYTPKIEALMREGLAFDRRQAFDPSQMGVMLVTLGAEALGLLAPLFLATMAAALITPFLFGGYVFSPKALTPDLSRLDPLRGIKRMFSWHSLNEMVKGVLKALLLGGIVGWVVLAEQDNLFALIKQPLPLAAVSFGQLLLYAWMAFVAGLMIVAAVDVPFQLWRYYQGLRMTRAELKQEMKELEGDPQIKARIRQQQRELARKRMMSEVPKADVVVTNPTHYAVALKYDAAKMSAPKVVAKGMNAVAEKIRSLAREHNVPVLELPPLARALYRHVDLDETIPAKLYTAVAEVMAYVWQLNRYLSEGGAPPLQPAAVPVPPELDPGAPD